MKKKALIGTTDVVNLLNDFMFEYHLTAKEIAAHSSWTEHNLSLFKGGAGPR